MMMTGYNSHMITVYCIDLHTYLLGLKYTYYLVVFRVFVIV